LAGAARARRAVLCGFFPMGPGPSRNRGGRDPGALGRIPVHLVRRTALSQGRPIDRKPRPGAQRGLCGGEIEMDTRYAAPQGGGADGAKREAGREEVPFRSNPLERMVLLLSRRPRVKTPLPLLILAGVGWLSVLWTSWVKRDWISAAPAIAAAAILLIVIPQNLSIGVRHVLAIYPLMANPGGRRRSQPLEFPRQQAVSRRAIAVALLAWQIVASAGAHPDCLAYFNELAGRRPEKILITSDLDWGQDLLRLSSTLKEKRVQFVSVAYSGEAD